MHRVGAFAVQLMRVATASPSERSEGSCEVSIFANGAFRVIPEAYPICPESARTIVTSYRGFYGRTEIAALGDFAVFAPGELAR